jgi:hypothetical protein
LWSTWASPGHLASQELQVLQVAVFQVRAITMLAAVPACTPPCGDEPLAGTAAVGVGVGHGHAEALELGLGFLPFAFLLALPAV